MKNGGSYSSPVAHATISIPTVGEIDDIAFVAGIIFEPADRLTWQ